MLDLMSIAYENMAIKHSIQEDGKQVFRLV